MQKVWQIHRQWLRRFFQTWGVCCLSALSRARSWRIRKYHSLETKGHLERWRTELWFWRLLTFPSIYLLNYLKCTTMLPLSSQPANHPTIHPTIHPSTHPSKNSQSCLLCVQFCKKMEIKCEETSDSNSSLTQQTT